MTSTADEPVLGAVDWGGTWIRVALVAGGRILHRDRVRRPESLPEQYAVIGELLEQAATAAAAEPAAVGIGVAGIVQHDVVMTAINIGITSATDVLAGIRAHAPLPLFLVNDAQAAALGLGGRWPEDLTAVITMGTGIGGAVISGGRLLTGNGGAGDFGHIVVQVDGPRCLCGGVGCLEALVSGRGLAATATALATGGRSRLLAERAASGRALHAGDLQDAGAAGELDASTELQQAARAFVAGVRTIVATLDPQRIVLAGSLLADDAYFGRLVRSCWEAIRPAWCRTPLVHVADDEDAALLGAASYAAGRLSGAA
jgi:predicted NBD/HSP70 family sugar kinase